MKDQKTKKARILLLIAALSVAEYLYFIPVRFSFRNTGDIGYYVLFCFWGIFLGINWTWGYNRLFTEGVWFFKEKETSLTDNAKRIFIFLYSIHFLVSLIFSLWFLLHQQYIMVCLSVIKMLLILYAYHAIFRRAWY